MADGQRVRLMSDYSAGWPLWSTEEHLFAPESPLMSAELIADLRSWQDLFEDEFHWEHGWRTSEAEASYARLGAELLHRLRRELGPDVNVTLHAWPVTDPELAAWLTHRQ